MLQKFKFDLVFAHLEREDRKIENFYYELFAPFIYTMNFNK